jgi:hypothetical protein
MNLAANSFAIFASFAVECGFTDCCLVDLRDPLFVAHVVHVNSGIALKLLQAVNGTEIERFRMIVMAGSSVSNADFHFADWIDRHGNPPFAT